MKKTDLIKFVHDELTFSGALDKLTLPQKEIERIIDNETNQIYDMYREAVTMKYAVIPKQMFYTPEFRKTRTIQFPSCVRFITKMEEMKGRSSMWGINDPDISFSRLMNSDLFLSPLGSDTVAMRTIQWSAWDQMKNFTLVDIQHSWNPNNHTLLVSGHDPQNNVYIEFSEKVNENELWDNPWVRKWICAKAKKQLAKMLSVFSMNLQGGMTIQPTVIDADADKDVEECKEFFDKTNVTDWFVCFP